MSSLLDGESAADFGRIGRDAGKGFDERVLGSGRDDLAPR